MVHSLDLYKYIFIYYIICICILLYIYIYTGLLKRYILPNRNMAFSTKMRGNHHLQGNVQVYNLRIPDIYVSMDSYACNYACAQAVIVHRKYANMQEHVRQDT